MLSGKYGNLIGAFLGNASGRTKTSVAGQLQQGNFAMFTEVADWYCYWSECLKYRLILSNMTFCTQVKQPHASMTKDGMLTIRKLSWHSIHRRHYKVRSISRDSVILIALMGGSGVLMLGWNFSVGRKDFNTWFIWLCANYSYLYYNVWSRYIYKDKLNE